MDITSNNNVLNKNSETFETLQSITLKQDYIKKRQLLNNSFLLFAMYEPYNIEKDNKDEFEDFKDFINELSLKFLNKNNSCLDIILINSEKAESSLISAINKEQTNDYPYYAFGHPHIPDIELLKSNDNFSVFKAIESNVEFYNNNFEIEKKNVLERIKEVLATFPVIVFIKGTPHDPYCKFSRTFMDIIKSMKIDYRSFDIFQDEKIRGYMKFYHGFRTFPQLFVKGNLVGGLDIIKDLNNKGELIKMIPKQCLYENKVEEVKDIINKNEDVLFFRSVISEDINDNNMSVKKAKLSEDVNQFVIDFNKKYVDNSNRQLKVVDINKNLLYYNVLNEIFKVENLPVYFERGNIVNLN